jgi:hypothetical protein
MKRTREFFAPVNHAVRTFIVLTGVMFVALGPAVALAQAKDRTGTMFDVGGTDKSTELGAVNNIGKTLVNFLLNVVAPVAGVAIAVIGLMDLAKREIPWGLTKLAVGGAFFFLDNILSGVSKMGVT